MMQQYEKNKGKFSRVIIWVEIKSSQEAKNVDTPFGGRSPEAESLACLCASAMNT